MIMSFLDFCVADPALIYCLLLHRSPHLGCLCAVLFDRDFCLKIHRLQRPAVLTHAGVFLDFHRFLGPTTGDLLIP